MLGFKAGATIITKSNECIIGLIYDAEDKHIGYFVNTNLNQYFKDNDFSDIEEINLSEELYYKIFNWTQNNWLRLPVNEFTELYSQ